jgi:hypothetical protein
MSPPKYRRAKIMIAALGSASTVGCDRCAGMKRRLLLCGWRLAAGTGGTVKKRNVFSNRKSEPSPSASSHKIQDRQGAPVQPRACHFFLRAFHDARVGRTVGHSVFYPPSLYRVPVRICVTATTWTQFTRSDAHPRVGGRTRSWISSPDLAVLLLS